MGSMTSEGFVFAVFLMYGLIFLIYTASNGAILGLPSANAFAPSAPATGGFTDWLVGGLETLLTFFAIMFLVPLEDIWWMVPLNWAILGTTIYLFFKMIRGN